MFGLSFWELALIMIVALLVLGPERLPSVLRSVGRGMRELRKASSGLRSALEEPLDELRRPLDEIRQPLDDIRNQMVGSLSDVTRDLKNEAQHIEQRVTRELDAESTPSADQPSEPPEPEPDQFHQKVSHKRMVTEPDPYQLQASKEEEQQEKQPNEANQEHQEDEEHKGNQKHKENSEP